MTRPRRPGPGLSQSERVASLLAEIDALPAARVNRRGDAIAVGTDFVEGAYGIVVEAAKGRRMALGAYVRRAAYAMACHDLGIPISDAFSRDPRATRDSGFAVADPEGTKFGSWEIERLRGEDDES